VGGRCSGEVRTCIHAACPLTCGRNLDSPLLGRGSTPTSHIAAWWSPNAATHVCAECVPKQAASAAAVQVKLSSRGGLWNRHLLCRRPRAGAYAWSRRMRPLRDQGGATRAGLSFHHAAIIRNRVLGERGRLASGRISDSPADPMVVRPSQFLALRQKRRSRTRQHVLLQGLP
jgi:hypothetical protein